MKKTLFTGLGLLIISILYGQKQADKLDKILNRLEEIKTASYDSKISSSAPGDTIPFNTYERHVKYYINPADTFVGASFTTASIDNHNQYDLCYDGIHKVRFDWSKKNARVDTLTADNLNRIPIAPFFVKVKSLIEYTKNNSENSIVKYQEFKDSIKIHFYFNDKITQFYGLKPFIKESEGKVSKCELVVDKYFLPYKLVQRVPTQSSWETCTNIEVFQHLDFDFSSIQQIPSDFTIKGRERGKPKTYELERKIAPDWKLKEIHGDSISLSEFECKVILIQFTGIGCGPCHASLPFLKQLSIDKKYNGLKVLCIETWSTNISGIERYKDKYEINYTFLAANAEVVNSYKVRGVPAFFILDEKRVIKKVYVGYKKGVTDKKITKTIKKLLRG